MCYWIVGLTLAALISPPSAQACRCPQRILEAYYAAADVVFLGRVRSQRTEDGQPAVRVVQFQVQGTPYKGEPGSVERFFTPVSSSLCGSEVENGRLYLIFAARDEAGAASARFDTCTGTRSLDPKGSEGVQGFADVEAREVLPRLTALRRLSQAPKAAAASTSGAQLPLPGDPHAELIGLLELPSTLNLDEPGSSSPPPRLPQLPLTLYSAPDVASAVSATISKPGDVVTREYDYERKAAVVQRRQAGWYGITLPSNQLGWLREQVAGEFHPVADLIVNRLGYLTANWDGYVWPEPGAGYPIEHSPWRKAEHKEQPVNVLSSKDIGGSLWLQVEVLSASPCEGGAPKVVLGGWVPAYTAGGKLVAWFYSRGC